MVTLNEFKKKHSDKCRLIGLDLGSKRIGVSICDEKQLIATPFKTIVKTSSEKLIIELKEIIKENNIGGIIIGNPLNMDGSSGKSSQSIKDIMNTVPLIAITPKSWVPKFAAEFVIGTANVPQIPANKCAGTVPTTSSIFNENNNLVP